MRLSQTNTNVKTKKNETDFNAEFAEDKKTRRTQRKNRKI